jgi:predicted permease
MGMFRHLQAWFRRDRLDDELREELAQHAAWKAEALIHEGLPEAEARRRAAIEIGNVTRLREDSRAHWGFPSLDSLAQDVRYGVRQMRRSPLFTAVAVLSLAIGIGASAAVFSLADAMLFRKLAVADPDSLVVLKWSSGPVFPFSNLNGYGEQNDDGLASTSFSLAAFESFRTETARYLDIVGFADLYGVNLVVDGQGDTGTAHVVDGRFFEVLGIGPVRGRALLPADDRRDAPTAAVISHSYWMRRFGGASDAVGRSVAVNALPFTIVGVLPASFRGTGQAGTNPDVYLPFAHRSLVLPDDDAPDNPNYWWVLMIGRLKPGVAAEDARMPLDVLLKRSVAAAKPALEAKDLPSLRLLPGARGQDEERAGMRTIIATMGWVTAIVLLVACANVANILLARGRARLREIAVRVAIGASRGRMVRQMFTEAALLAAAGCVLGTLVARWISQALLPALSTGGSTPLVAELALDWRFFVFVAGIASGAAMVFGLLPATRSTDVHLAEHLGEARRGLTTTGQRRLLSGGLVAVQIALSLLLITGAGLLVRSLANLARVPLGFNPQNILLFQIDPARNGYDGARAQQLYTSVLEQVRAMPGVIRASFSSHRLISNSSAYSRAMRLDEVPPPAGSAAAAAFGREHGAYMLAVDGEFFSTMEIPLLRGRTFTDGDANGEPVAVVNRSLAQRLFGTEDAVGRQFRLTSATAPPLRIIGVCADARYASLRRPIEATAYTFYRQPPHSSNAGTFEVKTLGSPAAIAAAIREIVSRHDVTLPVSRVGTQAEQVAASLETERMFARLASLLGVVALALSTIGLYALLAYSVVQRTSEIGIRMALGAARQSVRWIVLRESLLIVGAGLLVGIPAAIAGLTMLDAFLYGLAPRDPLTLTLASLLLITVALAAAYIPASRASRVDPLVALRSE